MSDGVTLKRNLPKWLSSLPLTCAVFSLAMLAVFPLFACLGHVWHGPMGIVAAAVAGSICWLPALLALVVAGLTRNVPAVAMPGMLAGMLLRMPLPLLGGLFLMRTELAGFGVIGFIIGYYLFALLVETLLSLGLVLTSSKATGV